MNDPSCSCVGLRRAGIFPDAPTSEVTKVPKGCSEGFCHFWHLITLGFSRTPDHIRNDQPFDGLATQGPELCDRTPVPKNM
jgi:hypothetical protein